MSSLIARASLLFIHCPAIDHRRQEQTRRLQERFHQLSPTILRFLRTDSGPEEQVRDDGMDVVEPLRIQERPDSQRDRHVVPEGAQARNFHGQPGSQHALELVCRKEEGAFSVAAPAYGCALSTGYCGYDCDCGATVTES
jgi:hypothetical protein